VTGADIDGRADQYALAATAFHLLTGAPPFEHSNPVAVISQHLSATPPKLSDRRPELAHLDHVFATALAKDPAHRFGRSRQFATKLNDLVGVDAESLRETKAAGITVAARPAEADTQVAISRPFAKSAAESPPSGTEAAPTPATQNRRKPYNPACLMNECSQLLYVELQIRSRPLRSRCGLRPSRPAACVLIASMPFSAFAFVS
jgi:serine/threonine-protein kinase